jgi:hypothetical protein
MGFSSPSSMAFFVGGLVILMEREPLGEERSLDKDWVVMAAGKCEHLVVFGKVMEDGF